jgi:hypothetical protein
LGEKLCAVQQREHPVQQDNVVDVLAGIKEGFLAIEAGVHNKIFLFQLIF